jgi:CubicO group peptidase (beta-lactamase class C family)
VRVKALAAVAFLCAAAWGRADDHALVAAVDAIAAEALQRPLAGMSVAVGRGGAVLMAKGYGFANVELEAPARADTVYHVDSINKFLTAAAMLKLADEGRLDLDGRPRTVGAGLLHFAAADPHPPPPQPHLGLPAIRACRAPRRRSAST